MKKIFKQFIKFGLVGILSFIVDAGIYLVLTRYLAFFYIMAKAISFVLAATNSYIFNRAWTFRSSNLAVGREFSKFLLISVIGLGLNTLFMFLAVEQFKLKDLYGLVIATILVMFWNFTANKFWTFRQKGGA